MVASKGRPLNTRNDAKAKKKENSRGRCAIGFAALKDSSDWGKDGAMQADVQMLGFGTGRRMVLQLPCSAQRAG